MATTEHELSVEEVIEEEEREAEELARQTREAADWRPSPRGIAARVGALAALLLIVLAAPHLVPGVYVNLVARAAIYGIVALSLNILVGYAGQVSVGHGAFVGVGAFGSAYALTELKLPFAAALVVGALTGAVGALIIGAVALRLQGLYLALVTIAYAKLAEETLFNIRSLTGGGAGQPAPRPSFLLGDISYAYFCIAVLGAVLLFDWRLTASRGGRAIAALRDDERVAASWGINVTSFKLLAFLLSGIIAGVAGALLASTEQQAVSLDYPFSLSLTFIVMTVVGGVGSRWGVVQGGILFALLPTLLERAHENFHVFPFTSFDATTEPVIGALLLLLTLMFFPGGIAQQQKHVLAWLSLKRWTDTRESVGIAPGGMGARP
jgi:branched-chain amino acid transport system permease protein